jgi:hypothetical protein
MAIFDPPQHCRLSILLVSEHLNITLCGIPRKVNEPCEVEQS